MGRIRTQFVKRISGNLLKQYKHKFIANFNENKKQVQQLTDVTTKKLRNMIAGYITKKVKTADR